MKALDKKNELILLNRMIAATKRELNKGNRDRLYLESELSQLIEEKIALLYPFCASKQKGGE